MAEQTESRAERGEHADAGMVLRPRSGGRILVDALRLHGVDRVFCVPGESYLDVLDALYDTSEIQLVVAKHEGAAANMAEADGRLTGRPGICFVTRGPGATHASIGVHTAFQDSTPLILFIGQVERAFRGREAFQEVEFRQMFGPLAKWVAEVEDPAHIPEYLLHAFECATSGRQGPVVLSLPEDVLGEMCSVADTPPYRPVQAYARPEDLEGLRSELARSKRPLLILGGSGWSDEGCTAVTAFAEKNSLPVFTSFRRQDLFRNEHNCYAGHLTLGFPPYQIRRIHGADLIIALGARLNEVSTGGYKVLKPPSLSQRLIHVYPDANELGRVYHADLPVNATPSLFAEQIATFPSIANPPWRSWTEEMHREFLEFTKMPGERPQKGVDLAAVVTYLSSRLPPEAIVSNGAGNYAIWVNRFFKYKQPRTELAPTSGAMGYGLPAAIAAKLRYPERLSVSFAGDGCFLMYPQELATAVQYNAALIVLLVNNGIYGTIRMHQERRFPGRVLGTNLPSPDYLALARSFGAHAERVEMTNEFAGAFERAVGSNKPALLEICTDRRQITPDHRLPYD